MKCFGITIVILCILNASLAISAQERRFKRELKETVGKVQPIDVAKQADVQEIGNNKNTAESGKDENIPTASSPDVKTEEQKPDENKAASEPVTVESKTEEKLDDATTEGPKTSSKVPETTSKVPETTTNAPETTTKTPETTTKGPETTTPNTNDTTTVPTTSTSIPTTSTSSTTTVSPSPTPQPEPTPTTPKPDHDRSQFSVTAFIGGMVFAFGMMAIGFVAFKFYKSRNERNYHTL